MQIKSQTPENRYLKLYKKIITKATKFLLKLNPFDNQNKVQVLFLLQLIKEKFESYGKNELSFQNLCKLEKINFIDLAEDFKIIETIDGTKYDLNYGNNNSELVLNNEIEEIYHNLIVKAGKALIKLNPLDDSFSIAMILIQLTDINRIFDEFKYGFIDFDNLLKLNEINFNDYKADNGIISNIERTLGIKKSR